MTADLSRIELLVWCLIEDFHVRYGTDADGFDGEDRRVLIRDLAETADTPRVIQFEEVLGSFEKIAALESGNLTIGRQDREIWPNDADYCTERDADIEGIRQTITAQIRELLA